MYWNSSLRCDSHLISPDTPERKPPTVCRLAQLAFKKCDKSALNVTEGLSRHLFKDVFVPPTQEFAWAMCDGNAADSSGRGGGAHSAWHFRLISRINRG